MSESDTATDYVCEECRESVSPEATTCPHCGHDPGATHRKYSNRMFYLAILCAIFPIIGWPPAYLLYRGSKKRKRAADEATPAVEA